MQGCESIQVDWKPPAGGNLELIKALDDIQEDSRIPEANEKVVKILKEAHPYLIDINLAINAIPGMHSKKYCIQVLQ